MKKLSLILILLTALILTGCSSNIADTKNTKDNQKTKTVDKCTYDTTDKCDQSCTTDADCRPMTPKTCINFNQKNESDMAISFYTLPNCKCENKKCVVKE